MNSSPERSIVRRRRPRKGGDDPTLVRGGFATDSQVRSRKTGNQIELKHACDPPNIRRKKAPLCVPVQKEMECAHSYLKIHDTPNTNQTHRRHRPQPMLRVSNAGRLF